MTPTSVAAPPLVGRDDELERLHRAAAGLVAGGVSVVAIVGEPGIGKTSLARHLAALAARQGAVVLEGRAVEHERPVAFAAIASAFTAPAEHLSPMLIEGLGPEVETALAGLLPSVARFTAPHGPPGPADRLRYHRALTALLELLARGRPACLILDDAQCADPASVEYVQHLIARPPKVPVLVALAARPGAVASAVRDIARGASTATVVTLTGLSDDDAGVLLEEVSDPGRRSALIREGRGNPLYLRELARAGDDEAGALPDGLRAVVAREVAAAPASSRRVLEAAAVVGERFDPDLAAAAAGLSVEAVLEALDDLVARGHVREGDAPREFAFRDPIVRRAVYGDVQAGWRLGAHERVAEALRLRGAPVVARARHLERSAAPGDRPAADVLIAGAAEVASACTDTAARFLQAALAILPSEERARRAQTLTGHAGLRVSVGALPDARADYLGALDLSADAPSEERARLMLSCAEVELLMGRGGVARERLRCAAELLGVDGPTDLRALADYGLALAALIEGDWGEVRTFGTSAYGGAGAGPSALGVGSLALVAQATHVLGQHEHARRALDGAARAARLVPDAELGQRVDALVALGCSLLLADRFEDADDVLGRACGLVGHDMRSPLLPWIAVLRSQALLLRFDLPAAATIAAAGEEAARRQGQELARALLATRQAVIGHLCNDGRDRPRVTGRVDDYLGRSTTSVAARSALCSLAALELDTDPERCLAEILRVGGERLEAVEPTRATFFGLTSVRAALALGSVDAARRLAAVNEDLAARSGAPASLIRAMTGRAEVLAVTGGPDEAVAACRVAARLADRGDAPLDALDTTFTFGRLLVLAEERGEAIDVLRRVAAISAEGGALRYRDAAARELRRVGARLPAGPSKSDSAADGVLELSARELQIAELIAAGKLNKHIAAELVLSPKTIEGHLSRIYAKVGVRSRTELAMVMTRAQA